MSRNRLTRSSKLHLRFFARSDATPILPSSTSAARPSDGVQLFSVGRLPRKKTVWQKETCSQTLWIFKGFYFLTHVPLGEVGCFLWRAKYSRVPDNRFGCAAKTPALYPNEQPKRLSRRVEIISKEGENS